MLDFIDCILDCTTDLPGWEYVNTKQFYLNGGCYELAKIIKKFVPEVQLLINITHDHCAVLYDGKAYDASGEVELDKFKLADQEDIEYMENQFGLPEKRMIKGIPFTEFVILVLNTCNLSGILPGTTIQKKN